MLLIVVFFIFAFTKTAYASFIVAPNTLTNTTGNQGNNLPFATSAFAELLRYQQVFASSEFSTLSGPKLITQIALRPPEQPFGSAFTSTIDNIQINLSTTTRGPDNLSLTFADNVGFDDTIVHSGSLTISSNNIGPPEGPKQFDIIVNLQTPFLYDPSLGNLLLETRNYTGGSIFQSYGYDAHSDPNDSISRIGGLVNDEIALFSDTIGVVVQFTVVPLPPAMWLFGSGLCLLIIQARNKYTLT